MISEAKIRKLRPAELRRIAATAQEAERERKILALAEEFEEKERSRRGRDGELRK